AQTPIVADREQPGDGAAGECEAEQGQAAGPKDAARQGVDPLDAAPDQELVAVAEAVDGGHGLAAVRQAEAVEAVVEGAERRGPAVLRALDRLAAAVEEDAALALAGVGSRAEAGDLGGHVEGGALVRRG